jgi:hypothetical protein
LLGSKEKMQKVYVPVAQGIWWGVSKETRKERVPVARAFVEVREKPGGRGYLCPGDLGRKGDNPARNENSTAFKIQNINTLLVQK